MRLIIFFLLLLSGVQQGKAQHIIKGTVTDNSAVPLNAVTVAAEDSVDRILQYAISDGNGQFIITLDIERFTSVSHLVFSAIGYRTVSLPLDSCYGSLKVMLYEDAFMLPDIVVKRDKINALGDTISYTMDAYRRQHDNSVADVLRRMPGIEVDDRGEISFEGKKISNFYVEDMSIVGDRYSIITDNLRPDNISKVKVYRHHQHVKALKGVVDSDHPAINLTLKDGSVARQWLLEAAAGHSVNEAVGGLASKQFVFAKDHQAINILKAENSQEDIAREMLAYGVDFQPVQPHNIARVISSMPDISERWYQDHLGFLATTNILRKSGLESSCRINASVLNNITTYSQQANTRYLFDSTPLVITEDDHRHTRHTQGDTEIFYEKNAASGYARNITRLFADVSHDRAQTDNGSAAFQQSVRQSQFYIKNITNIVNLSRYGRWGYNGFFTAASEPSRLLLTEGSLSRTTIDDLSMSAELFTIRQWSYIDLSVKGAVDYRGALYTAVDSVGIKNTDTYRELRAVVTGGLRYHTEKTTIAFTFPLSFVNRGSTTFDVQDDVFVSPVFSVKYKGSSAFEISSFTHYTSSPAEYRQTWLFPVYTSYRTMNIGNGLADIQRSLSSTMLLQYRSILHGTFSHLSASWSKEWDVPLYQREYNGLDMIVSTMLPEYAQKSSIDVSGSLSQQFNFLDLYLSVRGSWQNSQSSTIVEKDKVPYNSNLLKLNGELSISPWQWITTEHSVIFSHQKQCYPSYSGSLLSPNHEAASLSAHHSIYFYFGFWTLGCHVYKYNTYKPYVSRAYFVNASVDYKIKRWKFSLYADNLSNQTIYHYFTNNEYSVTESVTMLRPRQVVFKLEKTL